MIQRIGPIYLYILFLDGEPDKHAGAALKADRTLWVLGAGPTPSAKYSANLQNQKYIGGFEPWTKLHFNMS
jgi:hypothetical protein